MIKREDIQDFDYLAEQGFNHIPSANLDLKQLSGQIVKRIIKQLLKKVFFVLLLITLAGAFFYAVYKKQTINKIKPSNMAIKLKGKLPQPEKDFDTLKNFVSSPSNHKRAMPAILSKKIEQPFTPIADTFLTMNLASIKTECQATTSTIHLKLVKAINSPITYIHNLKVSNYNRLYFNTEANNATKGLSSIFENWQSKKLDLNERCETPKIYLHEVVKHALWLFKQKHYSESREEWKHILQVTREDENCFFYLGLCSYYSNQFDLAIFYFDSCLNQQSNTFHQEAMYYKALSLLESTKELEARMVLNEIVKAEDFYAAKAKMMLSKLD